MTDTWSVTIKNTETGFAVGAKIAKSPPEGGSLEQAISREFSTIQQAFQFTRQWIENAITP